jgi:short subunit dehydrogenase
MSKPLENKLSLVTGSSRGIGAAIAIRLAAEGASVIVNYAASPARAEAVVSEIRKAGGYAEAVQADLSTVGHPCNMRDTTSSKAVPRQNAAPSECMLLILDVLLILARDRLKQNLVAARKRKEEAERAIEQAAQSWVLKSRLFILQFKFADFGV